MDQLKSYRTSYCSLFIKCSHSGAVCLQRKSSRLLQIFTFKQSKWISNRVLCSISEAVQVICFQLFDSRRTVMPLESVTTANFSKEVWRFSNFKVISYDVCVHNMNFRFVHMNFTKFNKLRKVCLISFCLDFKNLFSAHRCPNCRPFLPDSFIPTVQLLPFRSWANGLSAPLS